MSSVKKVAALAVSTAVLLGAAACSKGGSSAPAAEGEAVTLEAWTHAAGNKEELAGYKAIIDAFNGSQSKYKVELKEFPGDSYNKTVVAAAAAKKLPCLLDVDQPNVANWAWAGYLAPLEGMDDRLAQFMPNAVAKWNDKAYAYGFFDVSLTWVSRKSVLKKYDMRVPTVDQPWTQDEFMAGLKKMKASGDYKFPADMATGWTGEWWSYGFAPQLQSFGGDQINRTDYKSAAGVLNGPQAVTWAKWFAGMASEGYIAKKSGADPVQDFLNGKTALLWNGSWAAPNARKKFGDDVVFAPPVDFGTGPKVSGGSWVWGHSTNCSDPAGAMEYLKFAADDKWVAKLAGDTGNIPTTEGAAAQVEGYGPDGENRIFLDFLKKFLVMRPETPGYTFISTEFGKTAQDILNGADPQKALDQAVRNIDANQSQNDFFQS